MPHKRLKKGTFWALFLGIPFFLWGWVVLYPTSLERFHDFSPALYDENGELLNCRLNRDEKWQISTRTEDVDQKLIDLLVHTEDKRFYTHPGVDVLSMCRAVFDALTSLKVHSGGSTLTMQVVRLLEPRPRTLFSKMIEMVKALALEAKFSKQEILEMYLTLAPYGGNLQGVRTASLYYFGKSPKHLSFAEAALLVTLPQSPTKFAKDITLQKQRRNYILETSNLPDIIKKESQQDNLPQKHHPFPRMCTHVAAKFSHKNTDSSILKPLQEKLEFLVKAWPTQEKQSIAVLIADYHGKIRAYVGSKDFFNHDIHGQVDVLSSVRSPGSTLKPFVYGLAFDDGWLHPKSLVRDTHISFQGYAPANFNDVFHGDITITEALQRSLNVPVVTVLEKLGPRYFMQTLEDANIPLCLPKIYKHVSLPIALGGVGIRLTDLAALFNSLNREGTVTPLTFLSNAPENSKRILSKKSAERLVSILMDAPLPPSMLSQPLHHGRIALKTGTSSSYRDALAVGVNGQHVVLVWFGRPDGAPIKGQVGLRTATPLLLTVFDQFLKSQGFPHHTMDDPLPPPLKYFGKQDKDRLQLHFPLPGSILIKGAKQPLVFSGGEAPYTVFVNKKRIPKENLGTLFENLRPGFHHILIVDSQGNRAESDVRLGRSTMNY